MLLRNGLGLGSNPCRFFGAASAIVTDTANQTKNGGRRNFYAGSGTVIDGASIADTAAFPNGYEPPWSWMMAPKGGGLSAYNTVYGTGDLTITTLSLGKDLAAALTGSGGITAPSLALIVQLAAALTGSGTISAAALQAIINLAAALTGSGSVTAASLALIVQLEADLTASGTVTGALRGTAGLSADITVTGTGLTIENVASAVWQEALEGGVTAEELMRLMAAVLAGKVSGAGINAPVFRDVNDTKDRVSATTDASGNRTSVSTDPT